MSVFAWLMMAAPALACTLTLDGPAKQGGLLIGTAPVGSKVTVDGRAVRVAPDGRFLVGFGRDAAAKTKVVAETPAGLTLECPISVAGRDYQVQRIDGLPKRKVTPKAVDVARIKADNAAIGKVRRLDTQATDFAAGFIWPLKGRISGIFGSQRILNGKPRSPHNGVDIAAPTGTIIRAPAPGVVALVHPDMFYTGKSVMLDHGHGLSTVYVHMSVISVKAGQRVAKGDAIGKVGMTGRATGPHLHWGVSLFRTHLDPALLAGKMAK
ncbi:MAG: M23 family metallopeptidase [Rhodospirillaceae bacterium]|jgi:murein DD-endopeptidase MepM/ murein hydrolase activator NlpD|nr:M23 family metallopeptidase [Rhodospirillaceae bacterium]